jgi:hypothetical protein
MTNQIRRFSIPETENKLTSAFNQERELAKQDSGKMAKRHLPSLSGDSMGLYFV